LFLLIIPELLGAIVNGVALAASSSPVSIPLRFTGIVVLEAVGVNLIYAVGRLKLTDINKMRRYNAEMKAFRAEMSDAQKAGDKQKLERLKKKQAQMTKMQSEVTMENLKPSLLFMLPLLGLYYLVRSFIGGAVLAVSPIVIPLVITTIPIQLSFFWWYMICSFTFSGIITRLFGLTMD
jgi:uncharacterized membrane protein (DUF106 family)